MFGLLLKFLSKIFLFTGRLGRKNSFEKKLSPEEEKQLFIAFQKGDPEAEEKLVKHNLRLVAHIANKYRSKRHDSDDLISVGSIGLMKAIRTFSLERANSFSTYASRCIENQILMLFRSDKKNSGEMYLEDSIGKDKDGNDISLIDILPDPDMPVSERAEIMCDLNRVEKIINSKLDTREKEVISHRYGMFGQLPKTQKELAGMMNISRSYISRIEKRALEIIRNNL